LDIPEVQEVFGLIFQVLGRPSHQGPGSQGLRDFRQWQLDAMKEAQNLIDEDSLLEEYVNDRRQELNLLTSDYEALIRVVKKKKWDVRKNLKLEMMRDLAFAPGMMHDYEIIEKIREYFEENYELLRLEGGHSVTEDIKQLALTQVLYYFTKMREVATRVTDTEVKLTLPDQTTPKGRNFTIEGIVDIVRNDEETWMYDIKTHDTEYIESNKDLYEKQLNVYAHIWQELRKQDLDKTAIISTSYPEGLKQAHLLNDQFRIQYELSRWNPLIELDFDQRKVEDVIEDFALTVDCIEDKKFKPAPVEQLNEKMEGTKALFGTRVCRNCDARFSCSSYREYATSKGKGERGNFKKYFNDFGSDTDKEEWANANLQAKNPDDINY